MRNRSGSSALHYAARLPVLVKFVGQLWLMLSLLTVVPMGVAVLLGETAIALRYASGAAVLALLGWLFGRVEADRRIQRNEAFVIAAILFLSSPLLAMPALMAAGLAPVDALFEAVSGVTTTGLSTVGTLEGMPRSFLFGRAWMQWYGGLGIVVFGVALAVQPGGSAKALSIGEAEADDPIGGTKAHFRRILGVYVFLTLATIAALCLVGVGFFDALLYSLASVSTGGFAPHDASLAVLAAPGRVVVLAACLACSVSLVFYHRAWRGGLRGLQEFARDSQLRAVLAAAAIVALLVAWAGVRADGLSVTTALGRGAVMAVSAQTTAGFSSVDVGSLSPAAKLGLIASMFVGGGTGSTAGGLKMLRLLVVLALLRTFLARSAMPRHAVLSGRLDGKPLDDRLVGDALLILGLMLALAGLSWIPFVAAGHDPLDSLFEVVSALGTVGLSAGVSSPQLAAPLKLVLCADMLLGRLEILAWLVLFYPGTWIGKRTSR